MHCLFFSFNCASNRVFIINYLSNLFLEDGEPINVVEPDVVLDVVDSIDEVAVASCEVFLYHVLQQVA